MARPSISVVMTAYKRARQLADTLISIRSQTLVPNQIIVVEDGYDGGDTKLVCDSWRSGKNTLPVEYVCRRNRPDVGYSNPAIPKNIGIKRATGDILIIQCAEVKYKRSTDIENLIRPLLRNETFSVYAPTESLNQCDQMEKWMVGPGINPIHPGDGTSGPEFLDLCQAVWRRRVLAIGGFDEAYKYYGVEDNDFSDRLYYSGVDRVWSSDVVVQHQWHGYNERMKQEFNSEWGRQQLDVALFRYKRNE